MRESVFRGCHGFRQLRWTRRQMLRAGFTGLLGVSAGSLLGRALGAAVPGRQNIPVRARSVIFLFQWGGPSHIDMFDMKPHAPDKIRGPYKPIATSADGIQICELLPELAKRMHHATLIRSVSHDMKNHNSAGYYALTGHRPPTDDQRLRDSLDLFPAYGSVVDHLAPNTHGIPTFVAYPHVIRDGSVTPGQHASFLGKKHDPFFFQDDPNAESFQLPELRLPADLNWERLTRRRQLQQLVDRQARLWEVSREAQQTDSFFDKALELISSPDVRKAFDLSQEPEEVRQRYGRTTYGQSCLLARRLVEAGVKFVTVYFAPDIGGRRIDSGGWDTHGFDNTRMFQIVDKYHFPITEQTLPVLLDELHERGLLEETLVLWMGEFGRTPRINDNESRDHWPQCYTVFLAGGGVKQGYVYGRSDAYAMFPDERPVSLEDLAATIYYLLGIDPQTEIYDLSRRPLAIGGTPILDIVA